tara:strand:+ start:8916 stop:10124 length:1209 start_codon:yes stop_codon:yes gene_type:complete
MSNKRDFDIIVWGASGFTGRLVAEYLFNNYKLNSFSWAIAGRNKSKLEFINKTFLDNKIPIVVADSFDEKSLTIMAQRTKVICSTVGPYSLFGTLLVKSCINSKTDYCDLAGETQWIRKIIDSFHDKAIMNKVKIVNSCGYDSIPSDIGVYLINKTMSTKNLKISMRVTGTKGGFSGGTYASMNNIMLEASKDKKIRRNLINPYSLNPEGQQFGLDKGDLREITFDKKINSWISPFLMAGINTRIVRRSNAIMDYRYGKNFQYDEAIMTGKGIKGRMKAIAISIPLFFLSSREGTWMKNIANYFTPKKGEGPDKEERETGYFSMRFYIYDEKSNSLILKVTGDKDPGYGSTSKMLAESAVCLAKDSLDNIYGILTPSSSMGENILKRLEDKAGLKFELIDTK